MLFFKSKEWVVSVSLRKEVDKQLETDSQVQPTVDRVEPDANRLGTDGAYSHFSP